VEDVNENNVISRSLRTAIHLRQLKNTNVNVQQTSSRCRHKSHRRHLCGLNSYENDSEKHKNENEEMRRRALKIHNKNN
jgi:hypothetical protein